MKTSAGIRKKISLILLPAMILYTFSPCFAGEMTNREQLSVVSCQLSAKNREITGQAVNTTNHAFSMNHEPSIMNQGETADVNSIENEIQHSTLNIQNSPIPSSSTVNTGGTPVLHSTNQSQAGRLCYIDPPVPHSTLNTQHSTLSSSPSSFSINKNPFEYSGYYKDQESDFYYLKARYYSPRYGVFISRDTYDLNNRYAYCDADPVMGIDPEGHDTQSTLTDIGIGVASFAAFSTIGGLAIGGVMRYREIRAAERAAADAAGFARGQQDIRDAFAGVLAAARRTTSARTIQIAFRAHRSGFAAGAASVDVAGAVAAAFRRGVASVNVATAEAAARTAGIAEGEANLAAVRRAAFRSGYGWGRTIGYVRGVRSRDTEIANLYGRIGELSAPSAPVPRAAMADECVGTEELGLAAHSAPVLPVITDRYLGTVRHTITGDFPIDIYQGFAYGTSLRPFFGDKAAWDIEQEAYKQARDLIDERHDVTAELERQGWAER